MTKPKWIDEDLFADHASRGKCGQCGDGILKARVGRTMAVDVHLDPEPVLDPLWVSGTRRLLWCHTGKRLLWRDHKRCAHTVYADHVCEGDEMTDSSDPFGVSSGAKKVSPYGDLTHPTTGKKVGRHVRVTNFIKGISDDFGLHQWSQRMTAKGLTHEDLDVLGGLDVSRDASEINQICGAAKRAAGGDEAARLGTHLHSQTEKYDKDSEAPLDPDWLTRIHEYKSALVENQITILPEMIERKICHTGYSSLVIGTFDRIVRLSDGTHVILDVKTGSLDPEKYMEKWLSIAAQLSIYEQAVNEHGVWDKATQTWQKINFKVRSDIALVAHLPARASGCSIYTVDLEPGRVAVGRVDALRQASRAKGFVASYTPSKTPDAGDFPFLISTAADHDELVQIAGQARSSGAWNQVLSDLCRARSEVLNSRG